MVSSDVKTIGLVTPRIPEDANVVLASNPAQSFGLIGALVEGGMESNRESTFKDLVTAQRLSVPERFVQSLTAGLQGLGYTVKVIPVKRDGTDFLPTYPPAGNGAVDAYLDVVTLGYGYIAAGIHDSTPYRPYYTLRVKAVRARDGSVLMQDVVVYNPLNPSENVISIAPDPNYQFVDFDSLTADPAKAAGGLQDAVDKSAFTVSNLLK